MRLASLGYFGHMWELYAMWTWLGAFLAASLEARGGGSFAGLNASAATFACVGLAGGLGAYGGGALADRWGRTTLTMGAMALSGLCYLAQGWIIGSSGFSSANQIPTLLGIGLILVWTVWLVVAALRLKTAALTETTSDATT